MYIGGGVDHQVQPGASHQLDCQVDPTYESRWIRAEDGRVITPQNAFQDGYEVPRPGTLVIRNFNDRLAGVYECQAFEPRTDRVVGSTRVRVTGGQQEQPPNVNVVVVDGPRIRVVQHGQNLELKCTAPGEVVLAPAFGEE